MMKLIVSCETFQRTGRLTQPILPTLPEKQISDTEVLSLLETINEILTEFDRPTCSNSHKNTFMESFMQRVDDQTTQYLNEHFIQ
jgi:hypothetical protein